MSLPPANRTAFLLGPENLEFREQQLTPPGDGELVLRIQTATTCGTDVKVYRRGGHPRMLRTPCPFGHEMAGSVAAVGPGVEAWRGGDRIVVSNSAPCDRCELCRAGRHNLCHDLDYLNGAFAEYLLVPRRFVEHSVYRLPGDLESDLAALAEPLACVLHGIDRMRIDAPCEVLVLGGGPIGLMFTQVLATSGYDVTLADPHPQRLEIGAALGAASLHRIDDRERIEAEITSSASVPADFGATIDASGSPRGWEAVARLARAGGVVNFFGGCAPGSKVALDATHLHYGELTLVGAYHHRPATFVRALEHLAGPGRPLGTLISSHRPLDELEAALADMVAKTAIKVALHP